MFGRCSYMPTGIPSLWGIAWPKTSLSPSQWFVILFATPDSLGCHISYCTKILQYIILPWQLTTSLQNYLPYAKPPVTTFNTSKKNSCCWCTFIFLLLLGVFFKIFTPQHSKPRLGNGCFAKVWYIHFLPSFSARSGIRSLALSRVFAVCVVFGVGAAQCSSNKWSWRKDSTVETLKSWKIEQEIVQDTVTKKHIHLHVAFLTLQWRWHWKKSIVYRWCLFG